MAKKRLGKVIEMMRDPNLSTFAFVMYPEATPVLEAYRAAVELRTVGIEPGLVVANLVIPPENVTTPFVQARRTMQEKYLAEINERFSVPVVQIPLQPSKIKGSKALSALGAKVYGENKENNMDDPILSDIEVSSPSVVWKAASDFANALAETPQFQAFEQPAWQLRQDEKAQAVLKAFRDQQDSLKGLSILKAVSSKDQAELDRLKENLFSQPNMVANTQAEAELVSLYQSVGSVLSQSIGIDFSAATSSGCCG